MKFWIAVSKFEVPRIKFEIRRMKFEVGRMKFAIAIGNSRRDGQSFGLAGNNFERAGMKFAVGC